MLPDKKRKKLLKKLDVAKGDVGAAEGELEKVLSEIQVSPRAEKMTVTRVVENAFTKLRSAKAELERLEELLKKKEPR